MTRPNVVDAIVEALRNAGATEETIAIVLGAAGAFRGAPRPKGRPRLYADRAECDRAYRGRVREKKREEIHQREEMHENILAPEEAPREEMHEKTPPAGFVTLLDRIRQVAAGHFDPDADMAPIGALLAQGCDLEADILPIVARDVTTLPRPLKNWGAPWLVREVLAARDQRLA